MATGNNLNIIAGIKLQVSNNEIKTQLSKISDEIQSKLDVNVNLKIKGVEEVKKALQPARSEADKLTAEINKAYGQAIAMDKKFNEQKKANAEKLRQQTIAALEKMNQDQIKSEQNLANAIAEGRLKASNQRRLADQKEYENSLKLREAQAKAEEKWYGQIKRFTPQSTSSTNSTQPINQSTQAMNNYSNAVSNLIQKYKMKKTSDEDFIKTANRIMENSKFQALSDRQQLQVLQQLTQAENNYNRELQVRSRIANDNVNRISSLNNNAPSSSVKFYDNLKQQEVQANAQAKMTGLQNRIGTASRSSFVDKSQLQAINAEYTRLESTIGRISNNRMAQEFNTSYSRLNNQVRILNQGIEEGGRGLGGYFENLKSIIGKFGEWLLVASLVMVPLKQLQDGIQYIVNMDNAMVDLAKVVDLTTQQLERMRQAAVDTGKEMGKSSADMMRSYAEIGRVYKNPDDIIELGKVAAMASNVTTLTAEQASKALNTTMLTFKLGVKDANGLLDQWNEIQNNYRTSAEDLAGSIEKVGAAAKQAGVSVQQLEGYTTAIVSSSGITGDEAGTSIKSMMARTFRIGPEGEEDAGKSEETLNSLGIAVRKNNGEFRSFNDILTDVKKHWSEWGNITQNNVSQVIAGTHHYSKFINLMENWDVAINATNSALHSQGSAINENAKYLDSISGRVEVMKTSLESVWASTIDADLIKGFVSGFTSAIDTIRDFNTILSITVSIIGMWKGVEITNFFKSLPSAISNSIRAMQSFQVVSTALRYQQNGWLNVNDVLKISFSQLATSVKGLGKALAGAFMSNPIGWISIAVSGFMLLSNAMEKSREETNKTMNETIKQNEQHMAQLKDLNSYYIENHNSVNNDNQVKKTLLDMQSKLVEAFGEEAKGIDLVNGKYEEQIAKIDALKKKKSQDEINSLEVKTAPDMDKRYNKPSFSASGTKAYLGVGEQNYSISNGEGYGNQQNTKEYYESLLDLKQKIINKDKDIFNGTNLLPTNTQEWANALASVEAEISKVKPNIDDINKLELKKRELIQDNIQQQANFNNEQSKMYDVVKNSFQNSSVDDYSKKMKEVSNIIKEFNGTNIIDISDKLRKILPTDDADNIINSLNRMTDGVYQTGESAKATEEKIKKANQAYRESVNSIQLLEKAQNELNANHKFSESTLEGLINKYDGVLDLQKSESELIKDIQALEEKERNTFVQLAMSKLETNQQFFNSVIKGNESLWSLVTKAYGQDAQNFANYAEAKRKTNELLVKAIGTSWSNLYSSEEDALQAMVDAYSVYTEGKTPGGIDHAASLALSMNQPEVMANIEQAKAQLAAIKGIKGAMKDASTKISFDTLDLGSIKDKSPSKSTGTETNDEKYIKEENTLEQLKTKLAQAEIDLTKNATSQKLASGQKLIDLQKEEIKLLEVKRKAINNIAYEEGQIAQRAKAKLKGEGIDAFDDGSVNSEQYNSVIDHLIGLHDQQGLDSKTKSQLKNRLDNIKKWAEEYASNTQSSQNSLNDKEEINVAIAEKLKDIDKTIVDDIFKKQESEIDKYQNSLSKLEETFDDLADSQSQEKFDVFENKIKTQKALIDELDKQIKDNGSTWWTLGEDGRTEIHNATNDKRKQKEVEQRKLKKNENDYFKLRIDSFSSDSYKYDDSISNVNEVGELIKPIKILNDQYDNIGEIIKNTNNEIVARTEKIKYLKTALESLNFTTSENAKQEEERQKAIKEITKDLNQEELATAKLKTKVEDLTFSQEVQAKTLMRNLIEKEKDNEEYLLRQREQTFEDLSTQKERYFRSQDEALSDLEEHQQRFVSTEEKILAIKNIQAQIDDWNLVSQNSKITVFDEQLSRMKEMNEISRSDLELLQKQLDIEKQRKTIANLEKEKTVRVFKAGQNGESGSFIWDVDQKALSQENDKLASMEFELATYQNNQSLEKKRQTLSDEKKIWDRQAEQEQDTLSDSRKRFDRYYQDIDTLVEKSLENLKGIYGSSWQSIIDVLQDKLTVAQSIHDKMVGLLSGSGINNTTKITTTTTTKLENSGATDADNTYTATPKAKLHDSGGVLKNGEIAVNLSGSDERTLSPLQTSLFENLVKNLPDITTMMNNIVSNIKTSSLNIPALANNNSSNTTQQISYNFNIDKIMTNSASGLISQMKQLIRSN